MDRTSPRTPFSTPLSGSARQAEARIRNLFQGPKRRPPVWLMVLALLLILSCGGLVTCQDQKVPPEKAPSLPPSPPSLSPVRTSSW